MNRFFSISHRCIDTNARAGVLRTAHGEVPTPVFMPVGTRATVKAVTPEQLRSAGARIILANTYHLALRPGSALIRGAGGLHRFSVWDGPILTDSGGYQIFSLAELRKISNEGVRFQSHIDGSYHLFTPESVIDLQRDLGPDIMMVLDECAPYPCTRESAVEANVRTLHWAGRSMERFRNTSSLHGYAQFPFAIVQGSTYEDIRAESCKQLIDMEFPGYAIGGLAVGEPREKMLSTAAFTAGLLPDEKPRYLMGVGKPEDIIEAISMGIDMFDCVIPTRNGRNGTFYSETGKIVIKNQQYRDDMRPISDQCSCYACRNFSRAYLRHLFQSSEILGLTLASIHNIHFYMDLVTSIRSAILEDDFSAWKKQFFRTYTP